MISGFDLKKFPDSQIELFIRPPHSGERHEEEDERHRCSLCCADHRWCIVRRAQRRKPPTPKRKSSAPRPSRLTSIRWSPSSTPSRRRSSGRTLRHWRDLGYESLLPRAGWRDVYAVLGRRRQGRDLGRRPRRCTCGLPTKGRRPRRQKARRRTRRDPSLGEIRLRNGRSRCTASPDTSR